MLYIIKSLGLSMVIVTSPDINGKINALIFSNVVKANEKKNQVCCLSRASGRGWETELCSKVQGSGNTERRLFASGCRFSDRFLAFLQSTREAILWKLASILKVALAHLSNVSCGYLEQTKVCFQKAKKLATIKSILQFLCVANVQKMTKDRWKP